MMTDDQRIELLTRDLAALGIPDDEVSYLANKLAGYPLGFLEKETQVKFGERYITVAEAVERIPKVERPAASSPDARTAAYITERSRARNEPPKVPSKPLHEMSSEEYQAYRKAERAAGRRS